MLLVNGLASRQSDLRQKVKGPSCERAYDAAGAPTGALLGFARSQGLPPEELTVETVKSTPFIFALKELPGQAAEDLLPDILTQLLRRISFPRPMYWESKENRFARPVRRLLALYGETPPGLPLPGSLRAEHLRPPFSLSRPFHREAPEYLRCGGTMSLNHEQRRDRSGS